MNEYISRLSDADASEFRRMQEVVPGLWIGGLMAAQSFRSLAEHNVTFVVDATGRRSFSWDLGNARQTLVVDVEDENHVDLLAHFHRTSDFIRDALGGGNVLVHCMAGRSRSASIVAAYLMRERGMSAEGSLSLIREARKWIDPNSGFRAQLREWESQVTAPRDGAGGGSTPISTPISTDASPTASATAASSATTSATTSATASATASSFPPSSSSSPATSPSTSSGGALGGFRKAGCELCELERRSRWLDESDPRFVILECDQCDLPIAVWRSHTMSPPKDGLAAMEIALGKAADVELSGKKWVIDKKQRTIYDHLHWHARPRTALMDLLEQIRRDKAEAGAKAGGEAGGEAGTNMEGEVGARAVGEAVGGEVVGKVGVKEHGSGGGRGGGSEGGIEVGGGCHAPRKAAL